MKIVKQTTFDNIFPYIAYLPEYSSSHPALLIQLHGAGERGNGGAELEKVLAHGFCNIATDDNLQDCILSCPNALPELFGLQKSKASKSSSMK